MECHPQMNGHGAEMLDKLELLPITGDARLVRRSAVAVRSVPGIADFEHFVAVVVDHLHGDLAFFWDVEGSTDVRIQAGPSASSISAFRVLFSFSYGLSAPVK